MKRVLSIILISCVCLGLTGCGKKTLESASDIFNELKKEESVSKYIEKSKDYTKKSDPNKAMGKDNMYISKVSWGDTRITKNDDDKYNGASIEFFNNEKDAKLRADFLEYYNEQMLVVFSKKTYGTYASFMHESNLYIYQKGNALITINTGMTEKGSNLYIDAFKKLVDNVEFKQTNVPSSDKVKKISKENKSKIDEKIGEAKVKWENGLNALASEMDTKVVNLQSSLSEGDYKDVSSSLHNFDIPYFSEKYNGWKEIVENARITIENNKKEAEEKAEAERKAAAEQAEAERKASLGRQNALSKANSYLRSSSFSYTRLIGQLEYEGFTNEQAVYAVDNCGADWNEQAALKAKSYMRSSSFSRQRLIEQLLYEGFSQDQAIYGVTSVGY